MSVFQTFFEIGASLSIAIFIFLYLPIHFMFLRKFK